MCFVVFSLCRGKQAIQNGNKGVGQNGAMGQLLTAKVLCGSYCWSSCSIPMTATQITIATAILCSMRPT